MDYLETNPGILGDFEKLLKGYLRRIKKTKKRRGKASQRKIGTRVEGLLEFISGREKFRKFF